MLLLLIVCLICLAGELVLLALYSRKKKKRKAQVRQSLYKFMEERVLSRTLSSRVTSEEASAWEYRSPFLLVEFPDTKPWLAAVFALDAYITVGRSKENMIFIRDDGVSRLHCKIAMVDGVLYLQDLGSANGTIVRRGIFQKLQLLPGRDTVPLQSGDKIFVGGCRMKIRLLYGQEAEG